MQAISFMIDHYQEFIVALVAVTGAVAALCASLVGLFLLIPGEQPEKFLISFGEKVKAAGEWIAKFSR